MIVQHRVNQLDHSSCISCQKTFLLSFNLDAW